MASMKTSVVPQAYPVGVHDITETIVIPRKRTNMGLGVGAPYGATHHQLPAGFLYGADTEGTVLRFNTSITTALISTEGYGSSSTGDSWNDDNTAGDTSLRHNLDARVEDLTVDGQAQFHSYPYSQVGTPDLHGPDLVWRADGLQAQSMHFTASRLRFYQIPGAAMRVRGANPGLASVYGLYDIGMCAIDQIHFGQCQYGLIIDHGDAKVSRIWGGGIAKDGIVFSSAGGFITDSHIAGADRALVFTTGAEGHHLYMEAARIGTHFEAGSDNSRVDGLNIGPGTCWSRGAKIEAGGITILNIIGKVMGTNATYTDVAGVELITNAARCTIQGNLELFSSLATPSQGVGVLLNGTQNDVDLVCGWNTATATAAAAIKAIQSITRTQIKLRSNIVGGCALDLSSTNLNSVNGLGNIFDLRGVCTGGAVPVRYPGGGTTYNLGIGGTKIYIDGTLAS